jgi:hypothetical protein
MKRKLIDFDVFTKIENESLSGAEAELVEAEDILSEALDVESVSLHCFGESNVVYSTPDDTYIHATYTLNPDSLILENIEELVIDEAQEKEFAKSKLSNMIEELLEGNEKKAHSIFNEYVGLNVTKRIFNEARNKSAKAKTKRLVAKTKKIGSGPGAKTVVVGYVPAKKKSHATKSQTAGVVAKRMKGKKRRNKLASLSEKKRRKAMRQSAHKRFGFMKEQVEVLHQISENVINYVNYVELGPTLKECSARYDEKGNVTALRVPTSKARNEGKILSFNWKTMNTEIKYCRDAGKKLSESMDFCKAMGELKRQNAFDDSTALEETLESVVVQWPNVIYLTQNELAAHVKEALEAVGVTNYDDQVCDFMAEGILRTAHTIHSEKVEKVLKLAGCTDCTQYECFQDAIGKFYPQIDESTALEMQAFYDLYSAVGEIYKHAQKTGDEIVAEEAEFYLNDLAAICEGQLEPDIDLAEETAEWIYDLIEANLSDAGEWNPTNTVHHTITGDHPAMAKKATVDGIPGKYTGDYGDPAPVSDGKSYHNGLADQMRNRGWSQLGGSDVVPDLTNPYVPKPFGDYTMKGEPGVDKNSDSGLTQVQGDTWPSLQNPYVPKAETAQSYQMNHGKEADLVVDK